MPVTKDQAQMLTTLALACRPIGAPRWHEPGVMAAVAKVKDWSLAEAITEVISAAADRTAETPGVIGKFGTHRKPPEPATEPRKPYDPANTCAVCSRTKVACEGTPRWAGDDHVFRPFRRHVADPVVRDEARAAARLALNSAAVCGHGVEPGRCVEHAPVRGVGTEEESK